MLSAARVAGKGRFISKFGCFVCDSMAKKQGISFTRAEALLLFAVGVLLATNLLLLSLLGSIYGAPSAGGFGFGYAPPVNDDSVVLMVVGGVVVALSLIAVVLTLKFQKSNEWIEQSFI